jgi:hypothetical protein
MWYILDENDNPVPADALIAAPWFEKSERRVVAVFEPKDNVLLSTVFLSLDHSVGRSKEKGPVLYESLWFGGPLDGKMRRYHTKAEALEGHAEMVREYDEVTCDDFVVLSKAE